MKLILIAAAVLVAGCSNYMGNVIPKENGLYEISDVGRSKDESLELALWSAKKTCQQQNKRHIVKEHKTAYSGLLEEGTAKWVPFFGTSDDYRTTVIFSCQA